MTVTLEVASDTAPADAMLPGIVMPAAAPLETVPQMMAGALIPRGALAHLTRATRIWCDAALEQDPAERFRLAHTAALRGAAAVLAAKPPTTGRFQGRPTSAWLLLAKAAPELSEWSAYFSDTAVRRAAIEAGLVADIALSDADELVSAARLFLAAASGAIGLLREQRQLAHLSDADRPLRLAG
jgi:hypothetical protein